ncbi:MAG: preprotein translocase subunit SecF [Actinomycetota bacterium]|nr:preprotein translocase subunit SecF [Actinomycetota bacterium]
MPSYAEFGNDLYTGKRSIDFVGRRNLWYLLAVLGIALSVVGVGIRGLNLGLEFKGGSEFRIAKAHTQSELVGSDAVRKVAPGVEVKVSKIGTDGVRVTTNTLGDDEADKVQAAVATAYGVGPDDVSTSTVGPTWGNDVSNKALQGLIVFMIAVSILIALYFHTWKMAASAVLALVHDLILTVGIYAIVGFEITPASVIGFLTILGYSLYDTVVVFDKVRENTEHIDLNVKRTYGEAANRAVNQTLIRSINTSVVALLPVASILFIGAFILGAGTLKDLSLALFVGIAAGTYSSIFIATPMLVHLREREPEMAAQAERVLRKRSEGRRPSAGRDTAAPADGEDGVLAPVGATGSGEPGPDGSAVAEDAGSSGTRAQSGGQRQQPRRGGPNPARKNNRQGGRR